MGWFKALADSVATSTLKLRYPMFKEARRQLALLVLDRFDAEGVAELLEGEAARDYGHDNFAAIRESAAGAVLARLVGASPDPWIEATRAAMERLIEDKGPSEAHRSTASDLGLAASLLSHDQKRIARAREVRWLYRPVPTECTFSTLLLAEADAVTEGSTHELTDVASLAAMGLQGNDVPILALVMSRSGKAGPPASIVGVAAKLDDHLTGKDGKLRVHRAANARWHLVRGSEPPRLELTAAVDGEGGEVWAVPWAVPPQILGPWVRLDELCRGEVKLGETDDPKAERTVAGLLRDPEEEIRLVATCAGELALDPGGVDEIRARLPAGQRWLRALHPTFQARLTLEVRADSATTS